MDRRELVIAIQDYYKSLSDEEKYCNNCTELHVQKYTGARGQVITPFCEGTCKCDENELIWAYHGVKVDRPLECILNGEKNLRKEI